MRDKLSKKISKKVFVRFLGLISLALLMCACGHNQVVVVAPTCQQALSDQYQAMTDYEISRLLDENLTADCYNCLETCWIPLMQKSLDDCREIPHRHLVKAVKVFNQQQYTKYFHLALYRYFRDLSQGLGEYREVDRELLRSYCSMLVRDSFTQQDKKLSETMELCRRLDPDLYEKMFR